MAQLVFEIKNQWISRTDTFKPVAKSKNYLYAQFNFLTDEWVGVPTAIFRNKTSAYEQIIGQDGTCLVPWEVIDVEGDSEIFVSVFCGDLVTANKARVHVYDTGYGDDLESDTPPTPSVYEQILNRMAGIEEDMDDATQRAESAAENAEYAAEHYPIIMDEYWYVWDVIEHEYVDTNIKAEAHDGTSATVEVEQIVGGHRVIITDVSGEHVFDVPDGRDGTDGRGIASLEKTSTSGDVDQYTMTFSDGSEPFVYYVTNGASATISTRAITNGYRLTITDKNGTRAIDVLNGAKGDPGNGIQSINKIGSYENYDYYEIRMTNGNKTSFTVTNGYSPTVSTVSLTGGHRVIITDANGSHSFDVMDGNGITNTVLNSDYTLTITFTDGTSYTTPSIRGTKGDTGNGIQSIAKTGTVGLVDTYTITYTNGQTTTFTVTNGITPTVDDALSPTSTNPVQNKVIDAEIGDLKAEINQLDTRVTALEEEAVDYELFETDATVAITKTVPAEAVKAVVSDLGNTSIVYNQIFPLMDRTEKGLTYLTNSTTGWTAVSGTSDSNTGFRPGGNTLIPLGHKGLCLVDTNNIELKTSLSNGFNLIVTSGPGYSDGSVRGTYTESFIYQTDSWTWGVGFRCGTGNTINGSIRVQVFDLTVMFGAGNEPSTIAEFKQIFPNDYYQPDQTGTTINITADKILLNGTEQSKNEFNVEENDVITIHTTAMEYGINIPVGSTVEYYRVVDTSVPAYVAESAEVTVDLLNEDADLRIMLFTDGHSYDDFKYKKYADMMSHGIVDYLVGLGDYKDYSTNHNKIWYKENLLDALTKAGRESNCLYCIGNHDVGIKGVNGAPNSVDYLMTPKENYDVLNRHYNKNAKIVFDKNNPFGGYYYVDDDVSKIRMIFLNTSDIFQSDGTFIRYKGELMWVSQRQLTWFAETACMLGKTDNADWSIIVFCHFALPYSEHYTLFQILNAVKNGTAFSDSFITYQRMTLSNDTWTTTTDEVTGDTISVNVDYTNQGAVDVCGIVFGHNHSDNLETHNTIKGVQIRCDNGHLDNYYLAPVSNYTAGTYYFYDDNGVLWSYTITSNYPDCAYIGYNKYFTDARMSPMPISRYDSNKNRIGSNGGVAITQEISSGAMEISGFVSERGPSTIGKESAEILCINKSNKTLTLIPYGTASKRVISY